MLFTRISGTNFASRVWHNSGFAGLSSKRSGRQAFNLRIRVRTPSTLLGFTVLYCIAFCCNALHYIASLFFLLLALIFRRGALHAPCSRIPIAILQNFLRCCRPVVQDSALSARKSGVQIPSAPPISLAVSPTPRSFNGRTQRSERCCDGSTPSLGDFFSLLQLFPLQS